jgi:hypothetical protein
MMIGCLGCRRQTAIRMASKTNSFAKVDFIDQPITFRENRSNMTARYSQPW